MRRLVIRRTAVPGPCGKVENRSRIFWAVSEAFDALSLTQLSWICPHYVKRHADNRAVPGAKLLHSESMMIGEHIYRSPVRMKGGRII